jgi:lipid-A-disaccharide synthase
MKKIFILTGETSGDKLASKVIKKLKNLNSEIEYMSVGGEYLEALGVKSIYNLKEITYLGFTNVLFNIFKIKKKINLTVDKIIEFNPDILFSVDSPDFTLRVSSKVKKIKPNIKTVHFVSPKIYVWREKRIKKFKSFLDHVLLLFPFEKKYFDKENIPSTFTGHPLLEKVLTDKIDLTQIIKNNKKILSIYPGSRLSEINILLPILYNFIKLMNKKYTDLVYVFHSTSEHVYLIKNFLDKKDLHNCEVISDDKIKHHLLKKSIFAIVKSGTVSLEVCNAKIPSIIIYKMNFINFLIIKTLVKIKYANIINIVANEEIIPELLQSKCNSKNIYKVVSQYLESPLIIEKQVKKTQVVLNGLKTDRPSSELASQALNKFL